MSTYYNLERFEYLFLLGSQRWVLLLRLVLQVRPIIKIGSIERILNLGNKRGFNFLASECLEIDIIKPGLCLNV